MQNITSIHNMNVDPASLTITGFHFHPSSQVSEWVDRIFGRNSVHYSSNTVYNRVIYSKPLLLNESQNSSRLIREKIDADFISNSIPLCSIDLLGSAAMKLNRDDNFRPFTLEYRAIGPAIGAATLHINSLTESWNCYYRGIYENWKPECDKSNPNYWSTFFYCPQFQQSSCDKLIAHSKKSNDKVEMKVEMKLLNNITWRNTFTAILHQPFSVPIKPSYQYTSSSEIKLGICLVIPYSSTDVDKYKSNGEMLQQWIRYYDKLNVTVFIYDRDGANFEFIDTLDVKYRQKLVYYSYSLRGLLDPLSRGLQYDNNEMLGDLKPISKLKYTMLQRYVIQTVDKTQTLTQCRFEAKAIYGIDHVIVADYDEFLYCPRAGPNITSQSNFLQNLILKNKLEQTDQLTFLQYVASNKTAHTRQCLIDKVNLKQSIFDCYNAYDFPIGIHSVKTIHLGHKCPLTNYHQACPSDGAIRTYDCNCTSEKVREYTCSFVHFTSNKKNFLKFGLQYKDSDIDRITSQRNEIGIILDEY